MDDQTWENIETGARLFCDGVDLGAWDLENFRQVPFPRGRLRTCSFFLFFVCTGRLGEFDRLILILPMERTCKWDKNKPRTGSELGGTVAGNQQRERPRNG